MEYEKLSRLMRSVLLIEDDKSARTPAAVMLRRHGWQVFEAEDGEKGIEMAIKHRPEVVLCDLLMPRGNGFQVCRILREHPLLTETKLIIVSGRDYANDLSEAREAGADEYLVKPVDFGQLLLLMGTLTHTGGAESAMDDAPAEPPAAACRVQFWGVRGSIPAPGPATVFYGGNTSCVEVRADGELIILDAGTGIRPLGHALADEFGDRPIDLHLLISHTHWDHIQGFPFFLPAYNPKNKLRILGYEGARAGLATTLAGQMESPYFPIALQEMPGNIVIEELKEMEFSIGLVKVKACFVNHPGICVGYRLETSGGSIAYLPDNETFSHQAATREGSRDNEPGTIFPQRMERELTDFLRGADIVIIDAQYDRREYSQHIGWGHGCLDDVVDLVVSAEARKLFLFHHDPNHDDACITRMVERARELVPAESSLTIEAAREGEQCVLRARTRS